MAWLSRNLTAKLCNTAGYINSKNASLHIGIHIMTHTAKNGRQLIYELLKDNFYLVQIWQIGQIILPNENIWIS